MKPGGSLANLALGLAGIVSSKDQTKHCMSKGMNELNIKLCSNWRFRNNTKKQ